MAQAITPTSTVVTASSDAYRDFLSAFETHIGGSSLWSVKQSTDNGAGNDYGITLTPDDTGESFDTNIRYDSTNGVIWVAIDPQGSITDALDPTGTGSTETSPENHEALRSGQSYDVDILVQEWNDAWGWLLKDTNDDHIRSWIGIGRVVEPMFDNSPSLGNTGLAWYGDQPNQLNRWFGHDPGDFGAANAIQVPGGWDVMESSQDIGNSLPDYTNATIPIAWVIFDDNNSGDNSRRGGFTKYAYRWHRSGGDAGLEVLDSGSGDGFIFVSYDGTGHHLVVPWDPAVNPT